MNGGKKARESSKLFMHSGEVFQIFPLYFIALHGKDQWFFLVLSVPVTFSYVDSALAATKASVVDGEKKHEWSKLSFMDMILLLWPWLSFAPPRPTYIQVFFNKIKLGIFL